MSSSLVLSPCSGFFIPLWPVTISETATYTATPSGEIMTVMLILITTDSHPGSHNSFLLPGRSEAKMGFLQSTLIGSGQLLRKCLLISAPVTEPLTPASLKRAVSPAGQSQGRSLFPVSIVPVSLHFLHLGILYSFCRVNEKSQFFKA